VEDPISVRLSLKVVATLVPLLPGDIQLLPDPSRCGWMFTRHWSSERRSTRGNHEEYDRSLAHPVKKLDPYFAQETAYFLSNRS